MKEGFDKEIDSLLRRQAGARAPSGAAASAHLDADELSAFAEGALPSAARFAAASHLADCVACRGVAVGLARSSEVLPEKRDALAASASAVAEGKRGWLASLFSPRVLKYAAPALAICLVAAVSFVALRTRREGGDNTTQVARSERAGAASAPQQGGEAAPAGVDANSNVGAGIVAPVAADESASVESDATGTVSSVKTPGEADAPDGSAGPRAAEVPPATTGPPPPPPAAAAPVAESAAPPPPPKAAQPEANETAKSETNKNDPKEKAARRAAPEDEVTYGDLAQQKRSAQQRNIEAQTPDGSRNRSGSNTTSNVTNDSLGASAPGGGDRATASRRGRSSDSARDRSGDAEERRAEETRSVAGHRFRREGRVWVDVNYKDSMSSTGVRRGTEAFRALVADFPELGRIAGQLGGEVLVVIRGRAYRIR